MKKTVNLETIVYCVYESEIEEQPDERTRESKKEELLWKHTRAIESNL